MLVISSVKRLDIGKLATLTRCHAGEFLSILWLASLLTIAETLTQLDLEQLNLTVSSYLHEIFSSATPLSEVAIHILCVLT